MRFYGKKILLSWIFIKTQNNIEEKSSDHKKVSPTLIEFLERLQLKIQDIKLLKRNNQKTLLRSNVHCGRSRQTINFKLVFYNKNKVPDWDLVFQDDPRFERCFHGVLNEDQFSFLKNFC